MTENLKKIREALEFYAGIHVDEVSEPGLAHLGEPSTVTREYKRPNSDGGKRARECLAILDSLPTFEEEPNDEVIYQAAKLFEIVVKEHEHSHGRGFMAGAHWAFKWLRARLFGKGEGDGHKKENAELSKPSGNGFVGGGSTAPKSGMSWYSE